MPTRQPSQRPGQEKPWLRKAGDTEPAGTANRRRCAHDGQSLITGRWQEWVPRPKELMACPGFGGNERVIQELQRHGVAGPGGVPFAFICLLTLREGKKRQTVIYCNHF